MRELCQDAATRHGKMLPCCVVMAGLEGRPEPPVQKN
jgi:hypothetical protein